MKQRSTTSTPLPEPPKVSPEVQDRIDGCLMGQAIGDALGARYEFRSSLQVTARMEDDMTDGRLEILGGGHLRAKPGQITDDTELALALARSILARGTYDHKDVCNAYCDWFKGGIGIGRTTLLTFLSTEKLTSAKKRLELATEQSAKFNQNSLSNGCLMRISPLAIAGYHWPLDTLLAAARLNCSLTNPNPIAQDAVAAYVAGVHTALRTGDARQAYEAACDAAQSEIVQKILKVAEAAPHPVQLTNGEAVMTDERAYIGYLGVALQNAFYEVLDGESFEKSLVDVVRRGGDTDTNGCIAGALLGAQKGLKAIPESWQNTVLNADMSKRIAVNPGARLDDLLQLARDLPAAKAPML